MQIQRSLLQTKALIQPSIYLRPEVDKILSCKLKDIVKRHQGIIVDKPSDATHIIFPPPNSREEGEPPHRQNLLYCFHSSIVQEFFLALSDHVNFFFFK